MADLSDLSAYLAAVALLVFAVYRLRTDRPGTPYQTQRYGYCLMICLALTMAMLAPATPGTLAGMGVDRTAVIVLGDAIRTAAMSLLMFMAYAVGRRPVRGLPVFAAVGTQLAGVTLFTAARPGLGSEDSLLTPGAGRWLLAAYDLLFAAYAAWALAAAAAAFWHEARRTGPGPVRAGIRISLAALAVGMAWTAWTVDDVVHVLRTGIQDGSEDLVSNVLGALCAALIVTAALVAKWHAAYGAARDRIQAYLVYRRLTPLWAALRAELPEIVLDEDRRVLLGGRSLDFALYRRVIEIHDGRLALRPHTPAREVEAVGLDRLGDSAPPAERAALIEAASIAAALENRRTGRRPDPGGSGHDVEATRTVAVEAQWLAEVATAFTRIRKHGMYPE